MCYITFLFLYITLPELAHITHDPLFLQITQAKRIFLIFISLSAQVSKFDHLIKLNNKNKYLPLVFRKSLKSAASRWLTRTLRLLRWREQMTAWSRFSPKSFHVHSLGSSLPVSKAVLSHSCQIPYNQLRY